MNFLRAALLALILAAPSLAFGQVGATPTVYLSAATLNATLVVAGPHTVTSIAAINTNATVYFLKLYNKATAPTCGTDAPVAEYALPAGPLVVDPPGGLRFPLGVGFCLTAGIAFDDTTDAAAGITIDFGVQ